MQIWLTEKSKYDVIVWDVKREKVYLICNNCKYEYDKSNLIPL